MSSAMVRKVSLPSASSGRPSKKRRSSRKGSVAKSMTSQAVHTFVRTCHINQAVGTTGFVPQVGLVAFDKFSIWFTNQNAYIWGNSSNYSTVAVPGYSDLAALFDEVRIDAVEITINCLQDAQVFGGGGGSGLMALCSDFNDHVAPTAIGDVQQYRDCQTYNMTVNRPVKIIVRPKFLTYSLDSAGSPIASSPKTGWIRSNLDIDHNCLKGTFVANNPAAGTYCFTFRYKYSCKIEK